jgi:hypothetical protein
VPQWVPSHCGLEGSEQADCLAKKVTLIKQLNNITITLPFMKSNDPEHHKKKQMQTSKLKVKVRSDIYYYVTN